MERDSGWVVIGMDPHKRSVTFEVMTAEESVVGGGRFGWSSGNSLLSLRVDAVGASLRP